MTAAQITDDMIAEWRAERGRGLISAVGEYTPAEFWLLLDEHERLREALREIIAINDEDQGTFRKRGGTRRGLSIVTAKAALDGKETPS